MIKAKLSFFKVQIERVFCHAIKYAQSSFSITPKRLNPVNMTLPTRKLIIAMVDSKEFIKSNIHQTIITTPAIRMNHRADFNMPSDNSLQRGFGAVWHDFRVYLAYKLQYAKYNGFAISAASTLTAYTTCANLLLAGILAKPKARKVANQLPEFLLCNSGTSVVSIFINHLNKLSIR